MAMRRLIIQIDDIVDQQKPTADPLTLAQNKKIENIKESPTEVTSYEQKEENLSNSPDIILANHQGKTYPDLIASFINKPQAIGTVLFFLPFPFFVSKIDSIQSLRYPFIVGILLNLVWFVFPLIISGIEWIKKAFLKIKNSS